MNYKILPKVELHRHLEGNFHPAVLYKMAQKNHLDFPTDYEEFKANLRFPHGSPPDFFLFLSKFFNIWYKSLDDVYEVVYESMKHLGTDDNLLYLELRFNPLHYAVRCGFDPVDTFKIVLTALNAAVKERGMNVRYLITFNRGFQKQEEMSHLLDRFIKETRMEGIVGLDLAGDEVNFPPELFTDFFQYAHANGYKSTIHAGEISGPDQVWCSVLKNYASRIGHGVAVVRDEKLRDMIKEKGIILEMCPISNYQTGAWPDTAMHPVKTLLRQGVMTTLNSDDPTVQHTELYDEYRVAHEEMGLTFEELVQLNHNAIQGCFLSNPEKQTLLRNFSHQWEHSVAQLKSE